ncbi:MAG: sulfotransferase [Streptosporangiaceae bacterium]|nr:sulfotransferase [Streptosporangiaceae bacterium]
MTRPPLKILCITGWCRNGSTIIGNILNELPGFFHVGELHFLWKNAAGWGANNLCGCGRPLIECPIWSRILPLGRPAGLSAESFAETVVARQRAYVRTRHTWRVLRRGLYCAGTREHADLMTPVYHAIAELTGARVLVDTTKIPGESALLPHLAGIEPYYVHLVRDPRAVAGSWHQPKDYAYAMSSSKSTAYWYGFNLAAGAITRRHPQRSMTVRYEDFIADPAAIVASMLRLCGAESAVVPLRDRVIELGVNHTVTGNPDRLRNGATVIRDTDDSWKANLPRPAKLAAAALSWPLFWRYGYRYVTGRRLGGPGA